MFGYSEIAVEIWRQILQAVIDVPYILDTMVDTGPDYWRNSPRYHDATVYAESEKLRRALRLVCHSWRVFADEHKHRWITYNPSATASSREQKEALDAVQSGEPSVMALNNTGSRPRRVMFHITSDEDVEVFRTLVGQCSSKVIILFTEIADGYEDTIFEHILSQRDKLSNLRCLAIWAPKYHFRPLSCLSTAFPGLVTLSISHKRETSYLPNKGDTLALPHLKILGIDLSAHSEASFTAWDLQDMLHLHTPISEDVLNAKHMALDPIKLLGSNLVVLNIHHLHMEGKFPLLLPADFWRWCPQLVELLVFFSGIYLDGPVPVNHPLRYGIHWPNYDTLDHPSIREAYDLQVPVLLHNLQLLPATLEVFVVSRSWSHYWQQLLDCYTHRERDDFVIQMKEICAEKRIRLEDEDEVTLDDFLSRKPMVRWKTTIRGRRDEDS